MKRIRSTFHTLHVLKAADPKLRKAIIANCNQEILKNICECALNVLRGKIPSSGCSKHKLRTVLARLQIRANLSPSERLEVGVADSFHCCLLYYRLSPGLYSGRVNYVT